MMHLRKRGGRREAHCGELTGMPAFPHGLSFTPGAYEEGAITLNTARRKPDVRKGNRFDPAPAPQSRGWVDAHTQVGSGSKVYAPHPASCEHQELAWFLAFRANPYHKN